MQFHWPSLFFGIVGALLIVMGVTGSYRTVAPALWQSVKPIQPLSEPGARRTPPGSGGRSGGGGAGGGGMR